MGKSALKAGTFIRYREQGEWSHCIITNDNTTWHQYVEYERIPKGALIHQCVWKGQDLEVRKVITKKDGPATYVPKPELSQDELNDMMMEREEAFLQQMKDTKHMAGMFLPGADPADVDLLCDKMIEMQAQRIEKLKKLTGKK